MKNCKSCRHFKAGEPHFKRGMMGHEDDLIEYHNPVGRCKIQVNVLGFIKYSHEEWGCERWAENETASPTR